MKGLTLVKNIIDVLFVLKCLHKIKIWRNMKEHIQVKKTYACSYCDKKFEGNQNNIVTKHVHKKDIIKKHERTLTGKKLYVCIF